MTVCKRVTYSGRVQGVGFRQATRQLAGGFAVSGYVRNLPNGAVELVAEGGDDDVRAFLDAVAGHMSGYIRAARVYDETPSGLQGFHVRY